MTGLKSLLVLFVICLTGETNAAKSVRFPIGGLFNRQSAPITRRAFNHIKHASNVFFGRDFHSNVKDDGFSTALQMCAETSGNKGVVALIDARPSNGICDNVCLLCNRLNISHLSLAWESPEVSSNEEFTISYHPPAEIISKAFAAHIKKMDWDRFSFLYENEGSFIRLQEVINSWRNDLHPIVFKKLDPAGGNREIFKHVIKVARLSYHIIDCEPKNIAKYMEEMQEIEDNLSYQNILLTSLDAYTVDLRTIDTDANVSTWHLTTLSDDKWKDIGIGRDPKKVETSLVVDALNHLDKAMRSLITSDWQEEEDEANRFSDPPALCYIDSQEGYREAAWPKGTVLRNALLQTVTKGLTGNIEFDENGKRTNFLLHYSRLNNESQFVYAGYWNSTTDTITDTISDLPSLSNKTLRVITREGKPYYTAAVNGSEAKGYVVDLMNEIFNHIRKSQDTELYHVVTLGPDSKIGNPIEGTRRWDGLIGELMEHKAAFAICDLTVTSERYAVVDFSIPFMDLGISMLFQVTPPPDPDMFSFVNPLSTDVWLYLAVVYILVSLVLLICARMSQDDWVNPHPCNRNPESLQNIWSLYNCMWLTMGSIMTQGCDILPRGYGSRWIAGTWYFFALIVTASYTANMSTFISNSRRSNNIENAKDLSEQTDVAYGALTNGSTYKFFESSNDTVHQKLWQTMKNANPTVFTDTNDEGKERVLRSRGGKYVFFMESTTIEYYMKQDCHLKMVGPKLDTKEYAIAMPKNSPYRNMLNKAILYLQESGKLRELKEKWWVKEDNKTQEGCPKEDEDDSGSLQMQNTSGIFLVLGMGGVLGLIIAIIGFLMHVREICVTEKISFKEALASEWRASLDPRVLNKPVAPPRSAPPSESPTPRRERSRSRAVSVLSAAQSFINLDTVY